MVSRIIVRLRRRSRQLCQRCQRDQQWHTVRHVLHTILAYVNPVFGGRAATIIQSHVLVITKIWEMLL